MVDVVIAGIGQTPVGEHWDASLRELALSAIEPTLIDSGGLKPDALFIGNMFAPHLSSQAHLGALIADFAGLRGIEAATTEASGASGGAALRMGYLAIASGQADVALVVGIEKSTDQVGAPVEAALATSLDSDFESIQGLAPTSLAALVMRRYLYENNPPREAFAGFPIIAHANAVNNPNAMFRNLINQEAYNRAGMVSDPLNLFDVAPQADGAAALMLTRPELLPAGFPHPRIRVSGSSLVTSSISLHDRPNPLDFEAARLSVERACRQAGILPGDADFFELYDAYSIYAALSLEAAGLAPPGQGWRPAQDGSISLTGKIPVSTMGGFKARGNPGGATGVYQAVEAVMQLRGQAGENQIAGARCALIQCLGGPASSAATHVLNILESSTT